MKVWVVYKQFVGMDAYDLANAEVYDDQKTATDRMLKLQVGDDSIDIDDVTVCEYEVWNGGVKE